MKINFKRSEQDKTLFRIIPHHSVLNSMNRKIWFTLHGLLALYNPWKTRLEKDGLQFTLYSKYDIWWIISMKAEENKTDNEDMLMDDVIRKIEFYVCVPTAFADVFLIKLMNHEQWRKCTIETVDTSSIPFSLDKKKADVYQMRYKFSNMFSLTHDYTRQISPVREIMNVSQELQPGDFVGMFVRAEAVGRKRWKQLADYAWGLWDSGGMPQRNGFDYRNIFKMMREIVWIVFNEVKLVIDSTMAAIENSFYGTKADVPIRGQVKLIDTDRAAMEINGALTNQTRNKRNLPVFATDINIVVNAPSRERRDMLASSVASSFTELEGNNQLELAKVSLSSSKHIQTFSTPRTTHMSNLMSTDELGKIIQLPTADVQHEFRNELESNQNTEIEIPKIFLDNSGIYMGTAQNRGEKFDIYLPAKNVDMLMTARTFLGSPRMGKDQAAINLVVESKRKFGIGSVVLDVIDERKGHRGMGDAIRDHLPPEDVIDIDTGNFDYAVYFGLQGLSKSIGNMRIAAGRIASEIANFLLADKDMDNVRTREYLRELAKATFGDIYAIKRFLIDAKYREYLLTELRKLGLSSALLVDYHNMTGKQVGKQDQIAAPILVRLNELLSDEYLKPMFCQTPNMKFNFEQLMKEGKVVIIRIPNAKVGELATKTLMHWLTLVIFSTKMLMNGQGKPTWLILNEPHQYLTSGFEYLAKRLLVEGPKKHIAPVFIIHNLKQLQSISSGFVEILMSSSLSWHIFKNTNINVYKTLKKYLEPTFTPEVAMSGTKAFHYIASWLDNTGEYQEPFMMKAADMVERRYETLDNSFLTQRHIRMYGRPVKDILEELEGYQKMGGL